MNFLNVPNLLTLARLLAVPFAVRAILRGQHGLALAIVLAAAVTDTIDGAVARRFGLATSVGAYLDPIVDKIFLSAVYISLALISTVPWWLVAEIFTRDVVILASSGALLLLGRMHSFPPACGARRAPFCRSSWRSLS